MKVLQMNILQRTTKKMVIDVNCSCRKSSNTPRSMRIENFTCSTNCCFLFSVISESERWKTIFTERNMYYIESLSLWAHLMEEIIDSNRKLTTQDVIVTSFQANIHGNRGLIYDNMLHDLGIIWKYNKRLKRCCATQTYIHFWKQTDEKKVEFLNS
jgi:hypothetical protein